MVKDTQVCFVSVCFGCNNKAVTKDHTGCLPGFFFSVFFFISLPPPQPEYRNLDGKSVIHEFV